MELSSTPPSQTESTGNSSNTLVPPTSLTLYFDPLRNCNPEIVANKVDFFKNEKSAQKYKPIKENKIRFLIMNPSQCSTKYDEMKRLTTDGKLVPAHLPNFEDLYGLHCVLEVLILWEMEKLKANKSYDVLPRLYESLFDPVPEISFDGPVYTVGNSPSRICIGTYTDATHILKVMSQHTMLRIGVFNYSGAMAQSTAPGRRTRSFNEVLITPVDLTGCIFTLPVEHGSKIIVWNARSIARPSFVANFTVMCAKHDPAIVVVVEARISRKNILEVLPSIPLQYKCAIFGEGAGLVGGVVMFYKEDDCEIRQVRCTTPNCVASVEFEGIFRHKSRKDALDITDVSSDGTEGSREI